MANRRHPLFGNQILYSMCDKNKIGEEKPDKLLETQPIWPYWLAIIGSATLFIGGILFLIFGGKVLPSTVGGTGDYFQGLLGPWIALIGALLTFVAFYIQYSFNKVQLIANNKSLLAANEAVQLQAEANKKAATANRQAAKHNRKAIELQQVEIARNAQKSEEEEEQYRKERFEQKFFELLRFTRETQSQITFTLKGRKADGDEISGVMTFKYFFRELDLCFGAVGGVMKSMWPGIDNKLDQFFWTYEICYFGFPTANKPLCAIEYKGKESEELLKDIQALIKSFKGNGSVGRFDQSTIDSIEGYKNSLDRNYMMGTPQLIGMQTFFSSYWRQLYYCVELLDSYKKSGSIDEKEAQFLGSILRSTLTDEAQALLYLNSITQFGRKWWDKEYLQTFSLLKSVVWDQIPKILRPGNLVDELMERNIIRSKVDMSKALGLDSGGKLPS